MVRDMARQPRVLAGLLGRADEFLAHGRTVLKPGPGGRLFVCGCGDGLFAARAASGWANEAGLDWRPIGALDLVLQASRLTGADRDELLEGASGLGRDVSEGGAARGGAGVGHHPRLCHSGGRSARGRRGSRPPHRAHGTLEAGA